MNSLVNYIKDSYTEFRFNVEWPKWSDLQQSTIVVAVTTIILSIFLFLVDYSVSNALELLYSFILNLFN